MGIDLELADCAAARYRLAACRKEGMACRHEPECERNLAELLERAAVDRPRAGSPSEFGYTRRFELTIRRMLLTGMGYEAEIQDWSTEDENGYLRWRSQTVAGKAGIPAFKLRSNDRWLVTAREVDEALEAYAGNPVELRAGLELDPACVAWMEWLEVARRHGGFEAE
jgi:hypothetical protein